MAFRRSLIDGIAFVVVVLICVFFIVAAFMGMGCAKAPVNKCDYICRGPRVPQDCYCIQDEIESIANGGTHP